MELGSFDAIEYGNDNRVSFVAISNIYVTQGELFVGMTSSDRVYKQCRVNLYNGNICCVKNISDTLTKFSFLYSTWFDCVKYSSSAWLSLN